MLGSYSVALPFHEKGALGLHHKIGYIIDVTKSLKVGASIAPQDKALTLTANYQHHDIMISNDLVLGFTEQSKIIPSYCLAIKKQYSSKINEGIYCKVGNVCEIGRMTEFGNECRLLLGTGIGSNGFTISLGYLHY